MSEEMPVVADALMDSTMRRLWGRLEKPWIRRILRENLPATRMQTLGCDVIVHPCDNFTEFRLWEDGVLPEHEATETLMDRFAGTDSVIVDVGGNAGLFGLPILKAAGKKARAVIFEPNPVMQERLKTNIKLNRLKQRAKVMPFAVSDADGTLPLHVPRNGNLGQGRLGVQYRNTNAEDAISVPVKRLPDCLRKAKVDRVDFLKVDVEGLEDRVILPLLDDPDAPDPDFIYFEIAHDGVWAAPLLQRLEDAGYVEEQRFDRNALFRNGKKS